MNKQKTVVKMMTLFLLSSVLTFGGNIEMVKKDYDRDKPSDTNKILSYSDIFKSVKRAVVNISTEKTISSRNQVNPFLNDPFFREFFRGYNQVPQNKMERSLGSGVIISDDGYIITNNHVVDGADKAIVTIPDDKKEYEAKIIGTDPKSDLAVIKIEADGLKAIKFYDSDKMEVGDVVFAIGNPFGVGETITHGIISGKNRSSVGINEYEDFLQTDAPINPGNSGGALVNSLGYLVGINTAILTKSGGNNGVGFSIPSNMVERIADGLIKNGSIQRAWLGVVIGELTGDLAEYYKKDHGVVITSIQKGSPADKAGLKRGDLILEVEGKIIKNPSMLKNTIGNRLPDSSVKIKYLRGKKVRIVSVKLTSMDFSSKKSGEYTYRGLVLNNLTEQIRNKLKIQHDIDGVLISSIDKNSDGYKSSFREGDIIIQCENQEISTIKELQEASKGKDKKRYFVYRNGIVFIVLF